MKSILTTLALGLSLTLGTAAWAEMQHADHGGATHATAMLSEGQVKKVDKTQSKLTIKHGPLGNLGMPAMTMVFRVKDAATLDQVKPGDRIRFMAEKVDGAITVTRFEVVTP